MIEVKKEIAKLISNVANLEINEIESYIETPKDAANGDYAFPCFKLAKTLKKAPNMIANDIKENINIENTIVEKIENVNGYLNFYINKIHLTKSVFEEYEAKKEDFGKTNIGKGKNVVIDYSSPNIAKPFHIGHLRTTVIGGALYNIYKFLGYNTTGVNHLGDYGTQFGKLIEGYKRWENEYNIEENPIDELTKIYIRINDLCKEDETVLQACRDNFKKLEDGDEYCTKVWTKFRELSLKEFNRTYELLGSKFDSWNGEAFYSDKMSEVLELLEKSGKLIESEGARIIDLNDIGINTPCMIEKSNGSTTYATRDLAAILYRARTYDFDKAIYVTSYEQILHFKQVFATAKLLELDKKYTDGLVHVPYGMVSLQSGKMSTRDGNIIKLEDLLKESIERVRAIIEEKNPSLSLEEKEDIAKKVGIGAVIYNDLSASRIKDEIFDWNTALNFQGETGPYIQYIYVRTKSILDKVEYVPNLNNIDFEVLNNESAYNIVKLIYNFSDILEQVADKYEPSILARYLIELSQSFSNFYNENKIIVEEKNVLDARIALTYIVSNILKTGANLLGIKMPNKM